MPMKNNTITSNDPSLTSTEKPGGEENNNPEGGLRGWLVIFGGFCLAVATLGYIISWGTFQEYYETTLLKTNSASAIAWIGSIQYALVFLPGILAGKFFDMGYFVFMMRSSTMLFLTAGFLIAECNKYWHFLLCQGIALGVAGGFMYVPCIAATSQWFHKRRPIALSLVSLGVAVGGIVFPIIFQSLLPRIGFKWAIRTIGFINVFLFLVANLTIRPRLSSKAVKTNSNLTGFRQIFTLAYVTYVLSTFFAFLGLYTMLTFLGVSALQVGFSRSFAFYLIAIANANTAVGRIMSGILATRFGVVNIMFLFTFSAAVVTFIWPFVHNHAAFIVLTCIYGICSGSFVGLFPVGVVQLGSIHDIARRTGYQMSIMAIGAVIGPPISGAIVQKQGNFHGVGIYAGTTVIIAVTLMMVTKFLTLGKLVKGRF